MTPSEMTQARYRLGWGHRMMAFALDLGSKGADHVREMEAGRRPISGPIGVAIEAFDKGFRPQHVLDEQNLEESA